MKNCTKSDFLNTDFRKNNFEIFTGLVKISLPLYNLTNYWEKMYIYNISITELYVKYLKYEKR